MSQDLFTERSSLLEPHEHTGAGNDNGDFSRIGIPIGSLSPERPPDLHTFGSIDLSGKGMYANDKEPVPPNSNAVNSGRVSLSRYGLQQKETLPPPRSESSLFAAFLLPAILVLCLGWYFLRRYVSGKNVPRTARATPREDTQELLRRIAGRSERWEPISDAKSAIRLVSTGMFLLLVISMVAVLASGGNDPRLDPLDLLLAVVLLPVFLCLPATVILWLVWAVSPRCPIEELNELERLDDINAIGALTSMLASEVPEIRSASGTALSRLLPRLGESEAHILDDLQCQRLIKRLSLRKADTEFGVQMAIIATLKKFGCWEAIPAIRRLADGPWSTNNQERLSAAAEQALPALRAAAQEARRHGSLVRPSEAPTDSLPRPSDSPTELLLRVLPQGGAIDTSTLVRPSAETHTNGV